MGFMRKFLRNFKAKQRASAGPPPGADSIVAEVNRIAKESVGYFVGDVSNSPHRGVLQAHNGQLSVCCAKCPSARLLDTDNDGYASVALESLDWLCWHEGGWTCGNHGRPE